MAINLDNVNFRTICLRITRNERTSREWLRFHGLLVRKMVCENCGTEMEEKAVGVEVASDKFVWLCPEKNCQKTTSIRKGSFFEKSEIKLLILIRFLYFWSYYDSRVKFITRELRLSHKTVMDLCKSCRDVCSHVVGNHEQQIGGEGKVVEVGESKYKKAKYHRNQNVEPDDGGWVIQGIERGTRNCFMFGVHSKDDDTLLPIITQWIRPGTTVLTDEWWESIPLTDHGYDHQIVGCDKNFINPASTAHLRNVKALRSRTKQIFVRKCSTLVSTEHSYSHEFVWREQYGESPFHNLIQHIKLKYPL